MSLPRTPPPALLLVAAFSRHADLLALARRRLEDDYGPVALASAEYAFDQTTYYEPTMGWLVLLATTCSCGCRTVPPARISP
jgi:hypothetical protein